MNEKVIWDFLLERIGNPVGVAALMGNLYAESGLNPVNLQNTYERKLGTTDAAYTASIDRGAYSAASFTADGAGYGLAQWTYWRRKKALIAFAKDQNKSIGDLKMQLAYLWKELQGYKAVLAALIDATDIRTASDVVLTQFERPANQSDTVKAKRAGYGMKYYTAYAGQEAVSVGFDKQKVIDIALAEEGYVEKASNKDLDSKTGNAGSKNYTKYARDLDAIPGFYNGKKQGVAWCDVFVDWCFVQAYGVDDGRALLCQPLKSAGAGCRYSRQYYMSKGQLFDSPEAGDQVFFYPKDGIGGSVIQHTGLVYKVDKTYVYTVEGNTSTASGVVANGGGVAKKKYKLTYERLAGFGRPNYSSGTDEPTPSASASASDEATDESQKTVVVTASSVNVRTGNGLQYTRIGRAEQGAVLEWIATSANGWHAVLYEQQVAWVSGQYAEVRG